MGRGLEKIQGVNPQGWTYRSPESWGRGRSQGLRTDVSQGALCSGELFHRNPVSHATTWVDLQTRLSTGGRWVGASLEDRWEPSTGLKMFQSSLWWLPGYRDFSRLFKLSKTCVFSRVEIIAYEEQRELMKRWRLGWSRVGVDSAPSGHLSHTSHGSPGGPSSARKA